MTFFFQTQFHIFVHHILTNLRPFCHARIALALPIGLWGVSHPPTLPPRSFTTPEALIIGDFSEILLFKEIMVL